VKNDKTIRKHIVICQVQIDNDDSISIYNISNSMQWLTVWLNVKYRKHE